MPPSLSGRILSSGLKRTPDMERWLARSALLCLAFAGSSLACAAGPDSSANALHAKYAALRAELEQSPFDRPLKLDSTETPSHLDGDVHAVVAYPFSRVRAGLDGGQHWCDVM